MYLFSSLLALCGTVVSASILSRRQGAPSQKNDPSQESDALTIADQFHVPIFTPALQGLETSKLILGNGIRVFIVSDRGIIKAGAAMVVDTGSWRDPVGALGLG